MGTGRGGGYVVFLTALSVAAHVFIHSVSSYNTLEPASVSTLCPDLKMTTGELAPPNVSAQTLPGCKRYVVSFDREINPCTVCFLDSNSFFFLTRFPDCRASLDFMLNMLQPDAS